MKTYTLLTLIVMTTIIAGCGVQKRDPAEKTTYLLNIERPKGPPTENKSVCLSIDSFKVASPFSGRSLVYRTGPVQYERDYYNLFLTSPDAQIVDAMQIWFRQAGFGNCMVSSETTSPQIRLKSQVVTLCADFQDRENPFAVVEMTVEITYLNEQGNTSVESTYTAKVPLAAKPTAGQVVEGFSESVSRIFNQLESQLKSDINSGS